MACGVVNDWLLNQYPLFFFISLQGGCVDSANQGLAALCMCLGPPDVSKCLMGPLTAHTIQLLRHLRQFLDVTFRVEQEAQQDVGAPKVQLTCVGVGFANLAKSVS